MNKKINILHLEDSFKDSELIQSLVESGEIEHEYFVAENEKDYINILETENIDIILSDYNLPEYNGNEALRVAREKYPHIPFIFVSGKIMEDVAIEKMLNGATDYVFKNNLERLVPAIKRALNDYELEIKRKQVEISLQEKKEIIKEQSGKYIQINKELDFQNEEKEKRAAELNVANKELAFQNREKERRADELIIAKEKAEESDRLKSAFLANMSHEIRTPMNGILGFAELLKEPELTGELQHEYIDIIQKSGTRMMNIISDIMSISKIESGHMGISISEMNINEQLKELHTFFKPEAEKKGLQIFLKNNLDSEETIVKTDRDKVYAILTNLIKNAIKFTNKGSIEFGYGSTGSPTVAGGSGRDKACLVSTTTATIEFYVKDTGIGIDPEKIEMIFERFRQGSETLNKKYEGAGLGLSISKSFVEMLGGKIWIEKDPELLETGNNRDGTGTTICFTIPFNT